jgi:YVTN family beta-propeller protein
MLLPPVPALRILRAPLVALAALLVSLTPASGAMLLVANKSEATLSLLDLDSRALVATLPTGEGPHEVAVSPDGRRAAVANYGGRAAGSTLTLVDLAARRVARTIELAPHRRPHGLVFLPDGRRLLVTAEESRALLVVDLERGVVERALTTGAEVSHMVALAPDGARAYVANIGSGSVTVLDLGSGERKSEIRTGRGAEGIAVTPDGAELWVTNREDDSVSVIDTASLAVVATLAAPDFPIRAEATLDGAPARPAGRARGLGGGGGGGRVLAASRLPPPPRRQARLGRPRHGGPDLRGRSRASRQDRRAHRRPRAGRHGLHAARRPLARRPR